MKLAEKNIYAGSESSLRIIARKGEKEVLVNKDELKWHELGGRHAVLTLEEIAAQLISLGYHPVFYVGWSWVFPERFIAMGTMILLYGLNME
ncbi:MULTISPECIES: hypothetical protein [Thermoactinomyces]|uniref:Uncharacterized protein n=1 Tax=Thermoactinomyces daqus TaxID=1329516 RepID=A0A7W2AJ61_9BACL|nr:MULTISPECIES: hypothetical protein [Thermoactinomyces]MBA4543975.1 hypothetical protein [Thermoactinomyces daqus]MBH8607977.1 hypothetical protein [Thermoactinomyces sp. CICC 10521]